MTIAEGGRLFIGYNNASKLLEDLPNKCRDALGIIPNVNLINNERLDTIEIIVDPSSQPISYKGVFHFRSGSTKQEMKGAALNDFILKKQG